MRLSLVAKTVVVVALTAAVAAQAQQPIVYPSKGQSPDQQKKDQGECYAWAQQQTGVDPVALAQQSSSAPAPAGPQGERVRGAARGAAVGAVAGELSSNDDAGQGAAVGAVIGTAAGGAKQRKKAQQQQQQAQAQQQQTQAALGNYTRAFNACMEGRGYVIK